MNSPDVLYFGCQGCGQQLSVPMALAGVTGPCPACHRQITAPTAQEAARAAALALATGKVPGAALPEAKTRIPLPTVQPAQGQSDAGLTRSSAESVAATAAVDAVQKAKAAIPEPRPVVEALLQNQEAVREKVRLSHAQISGAGLEARQTGIPPQKARAALPPKRTETEAKAGTASIIAPANVTDPSSLAAPLEPEPLAQQGAGNGLPLPGGNRTNGFQQGGRHAGEQERSIGNLLERNMGVGEPKPWTLPKEPSGRRGIFVVALLLVSLGIAGVSYAFQDQLRVMWHIYFPQKEEEVRPKGASQTASATARQTGPTSTSSPVPSVSAKPTPTPQKPAVPVAAQQGSSVTPSAIPATPGQSSLPTPASIRAAPEPQMLPPHPRIEEEPSAPKVEEKVKPVGVPPAEKAAVAQSRLAPTLFLKPPAEMKGAVEALREFLSARTWQERSRWVQWAETIGPLMEQYYLSNEDGAVVVAEVVPIPKYDAGGSDEPKHFVFELIGGDVEGSVPVMIEETEDGWKVDWLTFIESKDHLMEKFFSAYRDQPARFRVLARRKPFIENRDLPDIESKMCFEVQPPSPGFVGYVYAESGTPLASRLDRVLGWEVLSAAVVVELRWQRAGGQQWVEMVDVPYLNWRTPDPTAQSTQR